METKVHEEVLLVVLCGAKSISEGCLNLCSLGVLGTKVRIVLNPSQSHGGGSLAGFDGLQR